MERNAAIVLAAGIFLAAVCGFAYGTLWSSGCNAFSNAGAVAGCAEFVLYRYQTLLGIGGAVAAALITARPVWQQLKEMARQTEWQALDYLRQRSVELDREQTLIYEITSSIDIAAHALLALANTRQTATALLFAPTVVQFKGAETYMNEMIRKFDHEIGPLWGGKPIYEARTKVKEDAQRFSVALNKFSAQVQPNTPITNPEFDAIGRELAPLRESVFSAAVAIHDALLKERIRVAERISALEVRI